MSTKIIHTVNNISERLIKARKYADLSQASAASMLGISPVTLNRYEKGGRIPVIDGLLAIAKFYGVSSHWLITGEGPMLEEKNVAAEAIKQFAPFSGKGILAKAANTDEGQKNVGQYHDYRPSIHVPLISWVQAGDFVNPEPPTTPGYAADWLETSATTSKGAFALTVFGDSMSPEFWDGDVIVVDPDRSAENGSYIVAKNGEGATFKQLVLDGPNVYLKPLNERYPIRDMTGVEFRIVGVVVEKRKRY